MPRPFDDLHLPFDPSLMVYFRKRLTPEVLGEINEMIVQDAIKQRKKVAEKKDDDDDSNPPAGGGNTGTLIVDATCAPSDIRFPQDVSLLDEARENAEQIIDILQEQSPEKKPRTYRNKAHKDSLKYMRSRMISIVLKGVHHAASLLNSVMENPVFLAVQLPDQSEATDPSKFFYHPL